MEQDQLWNAFKEINQTRRSIRDFDGNDVSEREINEVLTQTLLAPSSGNLQPYKIHVIQNKQTKEKIAQHCNSQRAARSASLLIVFESSPQIALKTLNLQSEFIQQSSGFSSNAKSYYLKQLDKFKRLLTVGGWTIWTPVVGLLTMALPVLSLAPLSKIGALHWSSRNTTYAIQNLLLALSAKGIDACPMEGFSGVKVAKELGLSRNSAISLVVAVGYRTKEALIDPQWRRTLDKAVIFYK